MDTEQTPGFGKRMVFAVWTLVQAGMVLYGLGISGYLLARVTVGERWNVIAFANNFVPWWALGCLVLAGIGLISRRRWVLIAVQLPGLIAFVVLYGGLLLPRGSAASAGDGPRLTVATYNTLSSTSDPARVVNVIAGLDADIVGLQELGPVHTDRIADELAEQYPYQSLHPALPVHGVGLLSRYPILEATAFEPVPGAMLHMRAVLDVDGVRLTVYVAHPPPPKQAFSPLTYNAEYRDRQIAILRDDYLTHDTGPVIVMGDFNMTDQSDAYRALDRLLDDAYREAGRGLGFTFPGSIKSALVVMPPLLRIDYVWYNTYFVAVDAWKVNDSGTSDHYPVAAILTLKDSQNDTHVAR
ncbi:MAG: endonuclease/exonuclease/phosphatase family protein [Anaerolineae bacterium]|nr:endonuclease/exonuclease/phosphatase family protein [Anaerolineae bacterium]